MIEKVFQYAKSTSIWVVSELRWNRSSNSYVGTNPLKGRFVASSQRLREGDLVVCSEGKVSRTLTIKFSGEILGATNRGLSRSGS